MSLKNMFDYTNNYSLNDKCIASTLTADGGMLSDLLVPSLKLVHDTTSAITSDISAISDDVQFLLSVDRDSMTYKGDLLSVIAHEHNHTLTCYFAQGEDHRRALEKIKLGQFYHVKQNQEPLSDFTGNWIAFNENDYIVFNSNVTLSDVQISNFEVIYDLRVELSDLQLSTTLISSEINRLCSEISNDLTAKYKYLSDEISFNDKDIFDLSAYAHLSLELSVDGISTIVDDLCTQISNDLTAKYKYLSDEISSNDKDILDISVDIYKNVDSGDLSSRGLSGKVEFLLSSDKSSMCYGRTLRSIYPTFTPFTLKDFLSANFGKADGFLKQGFMFRLSSDQVFYLDIGTEVSSYIFFENDYFIVNKDVVVSDITSADVDIIYDASHESFNVSSDLCALRLSVELTSAYIDSLELSTNLISNEICRLSTEISNDIIAKYKYLSDEISSNDADISYISSRVNILCSEISNDLTAKYKYLSDEISSNDKDIFDLSDAIYREAGLSDKVEFLLSVGHDSMEYHGTALSVEHKWSSHSDLSDYLQKAFDLKFFKQGFMFKLSTDQGFWKVGQPETDLPYFKLGKEDFVIFNKDTIDVNATTADIEVIRNSFDEASKISADLSALRLSVEETSAYIDSLELSTYNLSNIVDRLCSEISNDLTSKYNWLSNETDRLCSEISVKLNDIYTNDCVKLSGNNLISNYNEFIDTTKINNLIANSISALLISINFNYLYDYDKNRKLSDLVSEVTINSYVLEVVTLINDIIAYAKFDDIQKINASTAYVDQICDRTYKICEKSGIEYKGTTFGDICICLNSAIAILPANEYCSSLEYRLKQLLSNIDFLEQYISLVENKLSSLSVESRSDFTYISGEVNRLCSEISIDIENKYSCINVSVDGISNIVDDLCSEVSVDLTSKYKYLSSELSDYHNTLSGIDRKEHSANDIFTDNLMLTDVKEIVEGTPHDRYYLQVLSGTLVLVPMK